MRTRHRERHRASRIGWLRAAVLGANDGIVSTASLILGVAAGADSRGTVLLAGVAGLVAGAMSMAAGEYVSVSSQSDVEEADLERERRELHEDPVAEKEELASIYMTRGLTASLAKQVADQLMEHDALGAHARDELGLYEDTMARPLQAAFASAASFAVGAVLPLFIVILAPVEALRYAVPGVSLATLGVLGGLSARAGAAPIARATLRVSFWGAAAMAATAGIGALFGHVIA